MKSSLANAFAEPTLIYAIGARITVAAGTRLALQLILGLILLFIVTTSPNWDWVICAPAAILRHEGHFSGPLSGIEPLFPVTHHNHGWPLSYHRKLIGEIFE
ncbi:hypothetical protein BT69DRAFT_1362966 [Atractiella rhizophila]|nr:hypothetical protein BT69DRAFT_1362966 [Atractiella rhizophila]